MISTETERVGFGLKLNIEKVRNVFKGGGSGGSPVEQIQF